MGKSRSLPPGQHILCIGKIYNNLKKKELSHPLSNPSTPDEAHPQVTAYISFFCLFSELLYANILSFPFCLYYTKVASCRHFCNLLYSHDNVCWYPLDINP